MPDPTPFADLVRRVRAGDGRAAEELVRAYETPIRVLVRSRLTDPALKRHFDSVDVCQSVLASFFVRVAAGQYDLESPQQLVGLLVRMAQNKLNTRVRFHNQQRRDAHRQGELDEAVGLAQGAPGPDRIAAGRELLRLLHEGLDDEERAIAELRGQGKGWGEIAAELGRPADGRRVQLRRALDRLGPALGLDGGVGMTDPHATVAARPPEALRELAQRLAGHDAAALVEPLRADQAARWRGGAGLRAEDY